MVFGGKARFQMQPVWSGAGIQILNRGKRTLVVMRRHTHDAIVWGLFSLLWLLPSVTFTYAFIFVCLKGAFDQDLAVLTGVMLLCQFFLLTSLFYLLQNAFPRRLVLDFAEMACRVKHLPAPPRVIPFADIASVDLGSGYFKGSRYVWLCLAQARQKGFLHIQELALRRGNEERIIEEMRQAAEELSGLLNRPLNYHACARPHFLNPRFQAFVFVAFVISVLCLLGIIVGGIAMVLH